MVTGSSQTLFLDDAQTMATILNLLLLFYILFFCLRFRILKLSKKMNQNGSIQDERQKKPTSLIPIETVKNLEANIKIYG